MTQRDLLPTASEDLTAGTAPWERNIYSNTNFERISSVRSGHLKARTHIWPALQIDVAPTELAVFFLVSHKDSAPTELCLAVKSFRSFFAFFVLFCGYL